MTARDDFDAPGPEQGDLFDPVSRLKLDLCDVDNAERIWGALRDSAVYVEGLGWLVWDGTRFNSVAGEERMRQLVGQTLRRLIEEEAAAISRQPVPEAQVNAFMADNGMGEADRETAVRKIKASRSRVRKQYAKSCGNMSRVKAAMEAARGRFLVDMRELDADRSSFQTTNGTVRLDVVAAVPEAEDPDERAERWASALADPPDRSSRPTRATAAAFDPSAEAPEWARFIELVMPNAEMRLYLQTLIGLTLFGQEGERMIVLLGQGGNGKSTFIRALRRVWGSHAESCRIEMFCEQRGGPSSGPTPEEAVLPGARVYLASEPDVTITMSAAKVKGLTGGDERQANPKNKALFSYTPVGIPIIQANKMPNVNDPSRGFWRRIYPVLFEVSLEDLPEADRRAPSTIDRLLAAEASGILNWALEGYAIYRQDGIRMPGKAAALKDSLQALADPVGEFLRERTELKAVARERTSEFYKAHAKWVEDQGGKPMGVKAFTAQMLARDFARVKTGGNWYWVGVELLGDLEHKPDDGGEMR